MILYRLKLKYWKKFRNPVEISLKEGLNFLFGPNEAGKSTLVEALLLLFSLSHTSKGQEVRNLIPWGTELSPQGEVEFGISGRKYRLSKGFFYSPYARLYEEKKGKWLLIAEGDRAEKKCLSLLGEEKKRGKSQVELLKSLWKLQGELGISPLPESVKRKLQGEVLPRQVSQREEWLRKKLKRERENYLTEQGRRKRNSPVVKRERELELLEEEVRQREKELEVLRELFQKLSVKKRELEQLGKEREALKEKEEEWLHWQRKWKEWEVKWKSWEYEEKSLKEEWKRLEELLRKWREGEREQKSLLEEKKRLEKELEKVKNRRKKAEKRLEQVKRKREKAEEQEKKEKRRKELEEKIAERREKLKQWKEWEDKLEKIKKELETLKVPSSKEWEKLEALWKKREAFLAKWEEQPFQITWEGERSFAYKYVADDGREKKGKGKKLKALAKVSFGLYLQGVGKVEVKKLGGEEEFEGVEKKWRESLAFWKVKDWEELWERRRRKEQLEWEKASLAERMAGKEEREWVEKELKEWEKEWRALKRKGARGKMDLEKLLEEEEKLEGEVEELWQEEHRIEKELVGVKSRLVGVEREVKEWREKFGSLSKLEEKLALLQKKWENFLREREKGAVQREKMWREKGEWEAWEKRRAQVEREILQCSQEVAWLKGQLESHDFGMDDLARLKEQLDEVKKKWRKEQKREKALELLWKLFEVVERERREFLPYLREKVDSYLKEVVGREYHPRLREDLCLSSLFVEEWEVEAPLEVFSFGTREQVALVYRLALALSVAQGEKWLVVLEDPLANTDPRRKERTLSLLEKLAEQLQILIVSCSPEVYTPYFQKAHVIHLKE